MASRGRAFSRVAFIEREVEGYDGLVGVLRDRCTDG